MGSSLGRVTAQLIQEDSDVVTASIISLINKNINPPEKVTAADVYVRAMYVVSDEVNSFGGRFPSEELAQLTELLVDSPVMVGHRKDKLPIGRNFYAVITERDGRKWVKAYFYWLKNSEGAESLRENIDGGIYKECSIGFTFGFPECSECGQDIRTCEHEPTRAVTDSGQTEQNNSHLIYFNYRKIERVLETSLVYRGAVADTSVSKELSAATARAALTERSPKYLKSLAELETDRSYFVTPCYEGLQVLVSRLDNKLQITRPNGKPLGDKIIKLFDEIRCKNFFSCDGLLIGYRGKERCKQVSLEHFLNDESSSVTRLELKTYPDPSLATTLTDSPGSFHRIVPIRYSITSGENLNFVSKRLATTQGVRIWPVTQPINFQAGYIYNPKNSDAAPDYAYQLSVNSNSDALFSFTTPDSNQRYIIRQYNLHRFMRGGRFIADQQDGEISTSQNGLMLIAAGELTPVETSSDGWLFQVTGKLSGKLIIRPVKLNGNERYLFYLVNETTSAKSNLNQQPDRVCL